MMTGKKVLFFSLLILVQVLQGSLPPLTLEQTREISEMLNLPSNTDPELYNQLIQKKVTPFLKEQFEKYHSGMIEPTYLIGFFGDQWASFSYDPNTTFYISIPIDFIAHVIKPYLNNPPLNRSQLPWEGIGFLHHEITHIKNQHIHKKLAAYKAVTYNNFCDRYFPEYRKGRISQDDYLNKLDSFLLMSRNHEWEADQGIPNHRLIIKAQKHFFKQRASNQNACPGDLTHPSDKDRAERFKQRLKTLLKERFQAVSKAFRFDLAPKVTAPHNLPAAPTLLKIKPETYESILDLIGEHKPIFDIRLQKTSPKKILRRRLFRPFVPFK